MIAPLPAKRHQKVWEKEGMGVRGKGRKEPFSKGFSSPSPRPPEAQKKERAGATGPLFFVE